ncbi:MAG TPA: ATP-binding protein [Candidatus Saccharimonadales bacterium]|jgi:two-component system sensor histidine kinase VicK
MALFVLYNLSRYYDPLLRNRIFSSAKTVIFLDIVFGGIFIGVQGTVFTPYVSFLIFMVITAAYQYRMRGVYAAIGLEAAILLVVWRVHLSWFTPLHFSNERTVVVRFVALAVGGWMVERYTRIEQHERERLRRLNQENETERSRLLTLIDSLQTAVFVVDDQGKIIQHNNAAVALLGDDTGNLRDRSFKDIVPMHARSDLAAKPVNILDDRRGSAQAEFQHRRDLVLTDERGQTLDLDIMVRPVRLEQSNAIGYIVICEDITHERSLDEQRAEFISVASHELRTPIAILEAALSTLVHAQGTAVDAETTATLLKQAHDNTLLLGSIIKDLSTLAEARNDNLPIKLDQLDPSEVADGIAQDFSAQVRQKGLELEVDVVPDLPPILSTKNYIREILQNYMTNAIKYSKTGTVVLAVAPTENGGVAFSVKDNGLGISAKDQKFLFRKFFRAEDSRVRETGGTGLGLYLCNELAERLGGRVWCQSALNKGSTFYLELPPYSNLRRDRKEVSRAAVANLIDEI